MSTSGKVKSPKYHHGNLRSAAIAAGLDLLQQQETEDISYRAVAREIKVTVNALYRHFPNKEGFLKSLADAGLEILIADQIKAIEGIEPGLRSLQAMGLVYIQLAIENPALFRLVAKHSFPQMITGNDQEGLSSTAHIMRSHIEAAMPKGVTEQQKRDATIRSWALVYGIAHLVLEGQISSDLETAKRIITTTVFWN